MEKLGAGAAIFSCVAVCGCVASPIEARQKYEQATADYSACFAANQNSFEACEGKRITMQNALSDNSDATCRSYGLRYGTASYVQCRENFAG